MTPVEPFITPANVMADALAQTVPLGPAFTVGAGVKVICLVSVTDEQLLLPVVVNVNVRIPPEISVAVGV